MDTPVLSAQPGSAATGPCDAPAPVPDRGDLTNAPSAGPDLLPDFLASRDALCPHCAYNLRGVKASRCPECGRGIQLGLVGAARLGGLGLFLLLALAWVFAASGMNAARHGHQIYVDAVTAAIPARQTIVFSAGSVTINGRTTTTWSSGGGGSNFTLSTTPAGGVTIMQGPSGAGGTAGGGAGRGGAVSGAPGGPAAASPAAPAGPLWSAVAASQWWMLGWWSGLSLLALAGLIALLVFRYRKRPPGRMGTRVMVATAGLLFACYAGYHVQAFTREVISWW